VIQTFIKRLPYNFSPMTFVSPQISRFFHLDIYRVRGVKPQICSAFHAVFTDVEHFALIGVGAINARNDDGSECGQAPGFASLLR